MFAKKPATELSTSNTVGGSLLGEKEDNYRVFGGLFLVFENGSRSKL
jgi:hypothetical protein